MGLSDSQEKDYAWGDLNQDGWIDLISVRKQPFTSPGRRTNVLFMNESGMLVDRTSLYATGSDVVGDMGFLTTTNDRDVVIVDVNADGWLDVVTATTLSPGQTKRFPTRVCISTWVRTPVPGRASTTRPPAFRIGAPTPTCAASPLGM